MKKINWQLFRSIIEVYLSGKISRERFITEWRLAQEALNIRGVRYG